MLKRRVHSTLVNFGRPCPVTDLLAATAVPPRATGPLPQ
jgi:hypothetical protein